MGIMTILRHLKYAESASRERATHDYRNVYLKSKHWISGVLEVDLKDSCVLVIGCGYNYPEPLLWSTACKHVVGIDIRNSFSRTGFKSLVTDMKKHGETRLRAYAKAVI